MDKKELKIHQQFHKALSKEKKKENELLKAKEEKRQRNECHQKIELDTKVN